MKYPQLTHPKWKPHDVETFRAAQGGDLEARHFLIESHAPLVHTIIKSRYTRYFGENARHLEAADLISEGILGLNHAIDKFDTNRGIRFSTYAVPWIHSYMLNELWNHEREIRIPKHWNYGDALLRRLEDPTKCPVTTSLDAPVSGDEDAPSLIDVLNFVDEQPADPDAVFLAHAVDDFLSELCERHLDVVTRVYGLRGRTAQSRQEIADDLGVTRSRVGQILDSAMRVMRRKAPADLVLFVSDSL